MQKSVYFLLFIFISHSLFSEDLSVCMEGWAQTEAGNHKNAIELFKQCIKTGKLSKSSLARTYRNIGIALNRDSQFKEAVAYYDKAVDLKPDDIWNDYVNRGNAWSGLGEFKKALDDYRQAQVVLPNFNEAYFNRGIVFEKQDKFDDAKKEFVKAYEHGLRTMLLKERFLVYGLNFEEPEIKLPEPPKGYSWSRCPEIKGAFLKPKDWHFVKEKKDDTQAYFITLEDIAEQGDFKTGVSINVIKKVKEKQKVSPLEFAQKFKDEIKKSYKFSSEWSRDMGPFKSIGFVYTDKSEDVALTVHNLLIANEKTGTLYIVLFEAPSTEWEKSWEIAEPILKYLYIDDSI